MNKNLPQSTFKVDAYDASSIPLKDCSMQLQYIDSHLIKLTWSLILFSTACNALIKLFISNVKLNRGAIKASDSTIEVIEAWFKTTVNQLSSNNNSIRNVKLFAQQFALVIKTFNDFESQLKQCADNGIFITIHPVTNTVLNYSINRSFNESDVKSEDVKIMLENSIINSIGILDPLVHIMLTTFAEDIDSAVNNVSEMLLKSYEGNIDSLLDDPLVNIDFKKANISDLFDTNITMDEDDITIDALSSTIGQLISENTSWKVEFSKNDVKFDNLLSDKLRLIRLISKGSNDA